MALLTSQQIKYLEKRLASARKAKLELSETIADEVKDFKIGSEDSISSTVYSSKESLMALDKEIKEIEELLSTAKVPEYDAEKIAVGTNFSAAIEMDGKIREEKYTLVESNPNFDEEAAYMQISISAPVGRAVYGKKVNETFEYVAPAGSFRGVITEIELQKAKEDEMQVSKQKTIGTHPSMKSGK